MPPTTSHSPGRPDLAVDVHRGGRGLLDDDAHLRIRELTGEALGEVGVELGR